MKDAHNTELFTNLSAEESATVQGGYGCRRSRGYSYRPSYYYIPRSFSYQPSYNYGYGYGGGYGGGYSRSGGSSSVNQTVNVNVLYDD